jgi:multicomponent Na+:H+ antiporter subunit E
MKWLKLSGLLLVELILGALRVAWLAVQPVPKLRPGIIAYPLTVTSDAEITLLANMITLTPGTLTIDVSEDRRTLYIHAIDIDSRERLVGAIAAGFETRVLEAFR